MNEALERLLLQVQAGTDCWIGGAPAEGRRLLAEAARVLAVDGTVVSVVAPMGELTLSSLIAQLSGRPDFDGQDDAVLEQGYRRLVGDGRTVLLLTAPQGIGRSALRYLQHVSRHAPRLSMAVLGSPPLAAALAEPGLEALQARWQAAPAIELAVPLRLVASREMALVPSEPAGPAAVVDPVPAAAPRGGWRRRSLLWSASAVGAVAVVSVIWVAYGAGWRAGPAMVDAVPLRADTVPLQSATVPVAPLLAEVEPAVTAEIVAPGVAAVPPAPVAPLALPPLLSPGEAPRQVVTAPAEAVRNTEGVPTPPRPERLPPLRRTETARAETARPELRPDAARREPVRVARARPSWPPPQYSEPAQYREMPPDEGYYDRPPAWTRRAMRSHDGPYLGTYAVDPYGMRVFRYDP